jgi:dipeptidyl aminopeptidase/acylaminoacyl peptidase
MSRQSPQPAVATEPARLTAKAQLDSLLLCDVQLSPHGTYSVSVRTEPSVRSKPIGGHHFAALSSIWLTNTNTKLSARLSSGPHHTSPRWSPDGTLLVFLARSPLNGNTEARSQLVRTLGMRAAPVSLPGLLAGARHR